MMTCDAAVLDGTPVVGGTRVPVRAVAAMLKKAPLAEVLRRYPMLNDHQVELCALYARSYLAGDAPAVRAMLGLPTVIVERVRRDKPLER